MIEFARKIASPTGEIDVMKISALISAGLFFGLLSLNVTFSAAVGEEANHDKKPPASLVPAPAVEAGTSAPGASAQAAGDGKSVSKLPRPTTLPKDIKKLIVEDTIVGAGKPASKGKTISVNYTGWLYDPNQPMGRGRQIATSIGRETFSFTVGGGTVIKGWDDGFENMKVGGKRKLIIPSNLAFGSRGAGTEVPPNSALMYEVELLGVK